ncbi:MAG: efflux RND transporter permease subunit [Planctomycetes bacterium]|nr:efflux RND transporter permease subunit [Planctomycetota bacterium]
MTVDERRIDATGEASLPEENDPAWTQRGAIAWFARNGVAANLLMILILVGGMISLGTVKKEVFPPVDPAIINVTVVYPGSTPEEVEESICRRIEEEVQGLTGIKKIRSSANEGAGNVSIEALEGTNLDALVSDVKNRVDSIQNFPVDAEEPTIAKVTLRRQVVNVAVIGDEQNVTERSLKELGQRVRDELASLPVISQVELVGTRPYEISIEVREAALERYRMTLGEVADAVRRSSLDLPGGSVKTDAGEILLRTEGQAYVGDEFGSIVVRTEFDGRRIHLSDVADVRDTFADTDQSSRFDGKRAVIVKVFRVGDQSALDISRAVNDYVDDAQKRMPHGISLATWRDDTEILQSRIDLLVRNAIAGLTLVFLVLALFLRFKLAFWVSLGIPISFAGAMSLMPIFGVSINMISLFAFIVVLGIVVDDAIVTGESVYNELSAGRSGIEASIRGTKRVALPVTFGVLTTIAAFAPMLDVAGNAAPIWRQIPLIVIPCLLFSLIESKFVLPAHLSHERAVGVQRERGFWRGLFAPIETAWYKVQRPFNRGLEWFADKTYRPSLEACLRARYVTITSCLVLFALTIVAVQHGFVRFTFFPSVEGDNVVASLTMPLGTPAERTAEVVRKIEIAALDLRDELDAERRRGDGAAGSSSLFVHLLTSIGDQPYKLEQSQNMGQIGSSFLAAHRGEVNIQLVPSEQRSIGADEIANRLRAKVGVIPDAVELEFSTALIQAAKDIDLELSHPRIDTLLTAATRLQQKLETYAGVEDVANSFRSGKREVKLRIDPTAEQLGIGAADLGRQVRQAFYGEEAQRIQRGRHEVKVMVRYSEDERRTLESLETMRIRTPTGDGVPFSVVADADYGRGFASIERSDLQRTMHVTAQVDEVVGNANEVLTDLGSEFLPQLRADFPGLVIREEGDKREQKETLRRSLTRGFLIALFRDLRTHGDPVQSYVQP